MIFLTDTPVLFNALMRVDEMKKVPVTDLRSGVTELFPISLSGTAAKSVVDKHKKHLARTMPSKIEIECTRAGIQKVLDILKSASTKLELYAKMKRQMADVSEAELREYAASQINELISDVERLI